MSKNSFKVSWSDCAWEFSRASGAGGQNVNKRSTKVRCIHRASGAEATCQIHRDQYSNRVEAFKMMAKTPEFKKWARIEAARRAGKAIDIDEAVRQAMHPKNIKVEGKKDGKWTPIEECEEVHE
jgi:protein subunit release factor B